MKYQKAVRNRFEDQHLLGDDPMFGQYLPRFHLREDVKNDMAMHPEIKKQLYSTLPENPWAADVRDEESA